MTHSPIFKVSKRVSKPMRVKFLTKEERKDLFTKRIRIKRPIKVKFVL